MKKIRIDKVKIHRNSGNSQPRSSKNLSNSRSPKHSNGVFTKLLQSNTQLRSTRNEGPSARSRRLFNFFPDSPNKSVMMRTVANLKQRKLVHQEKSVIETKTESPVGLPLAQFIKTYKSDLLDSELSEILSYKTIYFWGDPLVKNQRRSKYKTNDDEHLNLVLFKGDHIAYRYEILKILGHGSFGQVVECYDHKESQKVAVKIIKNSKTFKSLAESEIKILNFIKETSKSGSVPVIQFLESFEFRSHICIVTELLGKNLYELQQSKNFTAFPQAVLKSFAVQILTALRFLAEQNIVHCDLKPENILASFAGRDCIKIVDFGSSCFMYERVFSYIQSRYYRAPEVVLNLSYNYSIDIWSLGCILTELAIGKPLFPADCERELLQQIMEIKGMVPSEMLEKSIKKTKFFSHGSILPDKNGRVRQPGSLLLAQVVPAGRVFLSFIESCLEWDPAKRLTAESALSHPWLTEEKVLKKGNVFKVLGRVKFLKK